MSETRPSDDRMVVPLPTSVLSHNGNDAVEGHTHEPSAAAAPEESWTETSNVSLLLQACRDGCIDTVATALEGTDVNARWGPDENTALQEVLIHHPTTALLDLLLRRGASPAVRNRYGETALHTAARYNRSAFMLPLIHTSTTNRSTSNDHPLLERRNAQGQTALHTAAVHGHGSALTVLLLMGADPYALDDHGSTVLQYLVQQASEVTLRAAARVLTHATTDPEMLGRLLHQIYTRGQTRTVRALLDRFPSIIVNVPNDAGHTILRRASQDGRVALVQELLETHHASVHGDSATDTILHMLCGQVLPRRGGNEANLQILELLIRHGADVQAVNERGETPLHVAATRASLDHVTVLLQYGADPNARDDNGITALWIACRENYTRIAETLIPRVDPVVLHHVKRGLTCLHWTCHHQNLPLAELLYMAGARLSMEEDDELEDNRWDKTPLHSACVQISVTPRAVAVPLLEWLLERPEVSVHATDRSGNTPLHLACGTSNLAAVQILLRYGSNVRTVNHNGSTPLMLTCDADLRIETLAIAQLLVSHGACLTDKDVSGRTALHRACCTRDLELVQFLLNQKAPVLHLPDKYGWMPLHYACRQRNVSLVKLLLERGTDALHLNAQNADGNTPLIVACQRWGEQVVELLLDKGADPNVANKMGLTVLHYVVGSGVQSAVQLLTKHGARMDLEDLEGRTPFHMGTCSVNTTFFLLREYNVISLLWSS